MMERLHLFAGHGIELEYMLVDRVTLDVRPVCDEILRVLTGDDSGDYEDGPIALSNELALHVIEAKTNGPVSAITGEVASAFTDRLREVDALAERFGARLMPTAMHPTMDPARDTRLWPHGNREIYSAYDRAFGCSGHGWGNLQSCHLNLPFGDDDEFGRLHAAIRAVLGLLPALAASSPLMEGGVTGRLDSRLDVYAGNQRRVPSIIGDIIPEPVYSPRAYRSEILEPMYRDVAPLDPDGILQYEWLNSRGAIARFDRNAIEIRLLDVQETPAADLAITRLVAAVVRALTEERWVSRSELEALSTASLRALLDRTIADADVAVVDDQDLLRALGVDESRLSAGEVWASLYERVLVDELAPRSPLRAALNTLLGHGPLARRILRALGRRDPRPGPVEPQKIRAVYAELADCLTAGRLFTGP